jgi:carbonic anhydrase
MANKVDLTQHQVDTLVVSCVDFRYRDLVYRWITERFGKADHFGLPGASKAILETSVVLDWLKLLVELHGVKRLVVADHIDCGAYGGSKKFDWDHSAEVSMHGQQLSDARTLLQEALPGVQVVVYLLGPEGELGEINS